MNKIDKSANLILRIGSAISDFRPIICIDMNNHSTLLGVLSAIDRLASDINLIGFTNVKEISFPEPSNFKAYILDARTYFKGEFPLPDVSVLLKSPKTESEEQILMNVIDFFALYYFKDMNEDSLRYDDLAVIYDIEYVTMHSTTWIRFKWAYLSEGLVDVKERNATVTSEMLMQSIKK